jgi:3-oxoacyl-[acyl-carrier-protein] synthase-3
MGIRIRGLLAVVPANTRDENWLADQFGRDEAARIAAATGVRQVQVVSLGQTAADLAAEAARRLLLKLQIMPSDIHGVIFVSQTPEYLTPATACILQDRLGLPKQSVAFDVNLGCSAYPYGLAIAYGLLQSKIAGKILLLVADTPSLRVSPKDKSSTPLFGDAAVATLLEIDAESDDLLGFDLGSDGEGWPNLLIPVGQCRYRSQAEFAELAPSWLKDIRHPENVYMNGAEIFTFTLREVPGIVQRTLEAAKMPSEAVDYFFFHQANKFILDHLIRKMRLPLDKCPLSIDRFGNTSGASPALTACHSAFERNREQALTVMFIGYGVGYSWGGALVRIRPYSLFPIEYA